MTRFTDDFIEQYEKELISQEINANKRILNGFIWFLAAIAVVWLLTVYGIFTVDVTMVTDAFLLCFFLFLPAFYFIFRGDLSKSWIKYFLLTLLCIVCGVIISILSFHATLLYVFPLLYAIQYREKRVIWFTYFVNLLTVTAGMLAGFYYGLCDLNILLESQHTRSYYLSITDGFLSLPFNENPTYVILVYAIFPTAIILFILAVMLQYTVISNARDALRIAQLTYYKDMDTNTKVFNKNKYEEMITRYYLSIDHLAVIFWDLNNLKKVNDDLGHAAGDYIIARTATIIRSFSSECRKVYRIGGDEFVMILEHPADDEAEQISSAVWDAIEAHNKENAVQISSATGFAYGKGQDILNVVKDADEKMYENKKQMKQANGNPYRAEF